jgi:hypothetical protein
VKLTDLKNQIKESHKYFAVQNSSRHQGRRLSGPEQALTCHRCLQT